MGSSQENEAPSAWVCRFAALIASGGRVLDLACGHGRHTRYLRGLGLEVVAVDRDPIATEELRGLEGVEVHVADIESGPWLFESAEFEGIVVTNYLHRPLFPSILAGLRENGVLIYETFARGNERYGRPTNPNHLLQSGELLTWLAPAAHVVAFEQGIISRPKPAVVQRVCAVRDGEKSFPLYPP